MKAVYLFFREQGFYPIELESDARAVENALCNPGTIKVENVDGKVVWSQVQ